MSENKFCNNNLKKQIYCLYKYSTNFDLKLPDRLKDSPYLIKTYKKENKIIRFYLIPITVPYSNSYLVYISNPKEIEGYSYPIVNQKYLFIRRKEIYELNDFFEQSYWAKNLSASPSTQCVLFESCSPMQKEKLIKYLDKSFSEDKENKNKFLQMSITSKERDLDIMKYNLAKIEKTLNEKQKEYDEIAKEYANL